jgi:glycosyltransferase involved in cell wall biosynthesis
MNNKPIVSIITPTYNHEHYIGKCIESVIGQTFQSWEMIIIDDGSTDNTPEVISQYQDKRLKYIRQNNKGPYRLGEIYNEALSLCKGDYIGILEGDDFWPRDKLENQVDSFKNPKVVLSHGNYMLIYNDKCKPGYIKRDKNILDNNPIGTSLYGFTSGAIALVAVTIMIRKTALIRIGGFKYTNYLPYVDFPTELELSLIGEFKFIPKVLGYFRRHKTSITYMRYKEHAYNNKFIYLEDFLRINKQKIFQLGISEDVIKNNILSYKLLFSYGINYIGYGKELFELGDLRSAREEFKKMLLLKPPISFRILAYSGIIGAYCGINLCDVITNLYWMLRSTYGNIIKY